MKRCGFGFVLLGVLLLASFALGGGVDAFQEPVCARLEQAREDALAENWGDALEAARRAQGCWEKNWRLLASVTDHGPMEELDNLYAQLEVAGRLRAREDFAALCAVLAQRTEALADAHKAGWWNVL